MNDRTIGSIRVTPAEEPGWFRLLNQGRRLCAHPKTDELTFVQTAPLHYDVFLQLTARDLSDLSHIITHRWIDSRTRQVIRRKNICLGTSFALHLAESAVDLGSSFNELVSGRCDTGLPNRLQVSDGQSQFELILAEPRASALLEIVKIVPRSRRIAETLAVAVHRQIVGSEPPQEVFDHHCLALQSADDATGFEDLLVTFLLLHKPNNEDGHKSSAASLDNSSLQCPVVAIGTSCIVACALTKLKNDIAPMPFDWLSTSPTMIRHCLETNFEFLLDQTHYNSLTGLQSPGEPEAGCDHLFYKENFHIDRLFNHNDPTRRADYRYTTICVDRLNDLLSSDQPKLFVQCSHLSDDSVMQFAATANLIDSLTTNAMLFQLEVAAPDRRRAVPLLSATARKGRHHLSRMHPTSKMGGEFFGSEIDNSFFRWLIAAHSQEAAQLEAKQIERREALRLAINEFNLNSPGSDEAKLCYSNKFDLDWANSVLARFCTGTGLQHHFRYEAFESKNVAFDVHDSHCIGEITEEIVTIKFDLNRPLVRATIYRSLTIVYLLDTMLAEGPGPVSTFLIDVGDHSAVDCISFCSNGPAGCLVPDSDFVLSAGYSETRALVRSQGHEWAARLPVVFWRGATTGHRTKQPPDQGEPDDFSWLPRLDLCRRLRDSELAAHCDVGVTNIVQIEEPTVRERIMVAGLCKSFEGRERFIRHKYVLVIDGNSNAWSALFSALLSGSCVLIVESPHGFRQWYYDLLASWQHYVPVSASLQDLEERISWVIEHDGDAERIGLAGRKLAEALTFERAVDDAARRLREWLGLAKPSWLGARRIDKRRGVVGEAGVTLAHVQGQGDCKAGIEDWVGVPGSGRWIEGIEINLSTLMPSNGFFYQVVLAERMLSLSVESGYIGSRGRNSPLYGIAITAEEPFSSYDIEYEASFVDGSRVGPVSPGTVCSTSSGAALEAFRISIVTR